MPRGVHTHTCSHHRQTPPPPLPPNPGRRDTPQAPHRGPQANVSGSASARGPQLNPQWISDRYAPLWARRLDGQAHTCPVRKHSEPGALTDWGAAGGGRDRQGVLPTPGAGACNGKEPPSETGPGAHCSKAGGRQLQIQMRLNGPAIRWDSPAADSDAGSMALPSDGTVQLQIQMRLNGPAIRWDSPVPEQREGGSLVLTL